jgi:hypothetical protein
MCDVIACATCAPRKFDLWRTFTRPPALERILALAVRFCDPVVSLSSKLALRTVFASSSAIRLANLLLHPTTTPPRSSCHRYLASRRSILAHCIPAPATSSILLAGVPLGLRH